MTTIERNFVIKETLKIAAPPERVWSVFSDVVRWPKWNPVILSSRHLSGESWRPGSTIEFKIKLWRKTLRIHPEILEVESPNFVTWTGSGVGIYGTHSFSFERDGDGTLATTVEVSRGPGLALMWIVMPQGKVRASFAQWLAALKAEAERVS